MSVFDPDMEVIGRYRQLMEAYMVRSFLESQGIKAVIYDEHTASLYAHAFGEVKLAVRKRDVEDALALLAEVERGEAQLESSQVSDIRGIPCPKCGSTTTERILSQNRAVDLASSLGPDRWHCLQCQNTWKEPGGFRWRWVAVALILFIIFQILFQLL